MTVAVSTPKGGSWLTEDVGHDDIFTPERFSEEHRLIAQTADEFFDAEVLPNVERMESKDWAFVRELLQHCGALGLLGADVPESLGGVHLDKVSSILISERVSRNASFGTSFGAQTHLATLSILLFGTEEQKRTYVPRLVSGQLLGAYALSESGAGSDPLSGKARADGQADGSFVLNGEKMWISNGGFADVITVFAKVDGEHFTAFIVERAWPGVSSGKEEHKLGILGSSTTSIILQDVCVPAGSVLGEIGKGHRVAFNVLNYGRLKLGASCTGGGIAVIGEAARYAATRHQFGQAIANFGAIKHKIGEMTVATYGVESLLYRTGGLLDGYVSEHSQGPDDVAAMLGAGEEYAIEASIAKVAGTEMADFVIDEDIQIHGGNGFVKDYPPERHYRDARVNRIFEGTNEINRLLIPGMLMRRAVKGGLPIIQAAKKLQDELMSPPQLPGRGSGSAGALAEEVEMVRGFKKAAVALLGLTMQRFGEKAADEQEVMMFIADVLIDVYQAESAVLRAQQAVAAGLPTSALHQDAARVFVHDAAGRVEVNARMALAGVAEGDMLRTHLAALRRLLKSTPLNTIPLRRRLADATVAKGAYLFR
ncbi:MAG: acyl-CoA dehydrogenase family protein [Acidobacteriota bacterium]